MNFFARYEKKTVSNESISEPIKREPKDELNYQLDNISTEDFNDFVKYLGVKYASLSIAVKDAFEVLTTWNYDPMNRLNPREFQTFMNRLDYLELKSIEVPQPISFKGNLLKYLEDSKGRMDFLAKFNELILTPSIKRFGHYLANPEERMDTRGFIEGVNNNTLREFGTIDSMIKDNARWFDYRDRKATTLFGDIYHSNNEFVKCLYLTETYKSIVEKTASLEQTHKHVEQLKQVILSLMERLGKDEIKPSKEFITMVSDEVKSVAQWIEFYSLMMAMLMDVNSCLSQTETIIKKQL